MSHAVRYGARDGAITGVHHERCFNRPLYVANTAAFVLAGDRPAIRFASRHTLHGTFLLGLERDARVHWLHDEQDVAIEYRPAHFRWTIRPGALSGVDLELDLVALARPVGFAVRVRIRGARASDHLRWIFGGACTWPDKVLNWEMDPHREPLWPVFDPALCAGNRIYASENVFTVAPSAAADFAVSGRCSIPTAPFIAEATDLNDRAPARAAGRRHRPLLCGSWSLDRHAEATWSWVRTAAQRTQRKSALHAPDRCFAAGMARSASLAARVVVETPDERLNALAGALGAAVDGAWYPPVFRHGAMLWNSRYPGWRTVFGGTVAGWHERVRAQAAFYLASQVKDHVKRSRRADPALLLTAPAPDSRFFGRGRIQTDQGIYNMQSQFFDQLIHAWRWTGDDTLARMLRPALELHLEWIRECFDPDGDGLYESVINVWPTDSVWYGGGGAAEETSYACRAHTAARDLARHAGDAAAMRRHDLVLKRIRRAFQTRLWSRTRGHPGLYREQGGLKRLHEDAWLYSIFLPIDAGLLTPTQAAQALHYTEWGLQNDTVPSGGRRVWTSNFVPGIWSVRENWPGDNYHLALAYFQAGFAHDGWEIFRGNFQHTAFASGIPGDFGASAGGTDFGDCTSMFARTLVEGLFGYAPDYPNRRVKIAPQLPGHWNRARLQTADVHLHFLREQGQITLDVTLTRAAPLDVRIPVCAAAITSVTAHARDVKWRAQPGFGTTVVCVRLPATTRATLHIAFTGEAPAFDARSLAVRPGQIIRLRAAKAKITAFEDPQDVLASAALRDGQLEGRIGSRPGHATLLARVTFGTLPQWRLFRLHTTVPARPRLTTRPRVPRRVAWSCIDLAPIFNADIRTIFQQKYRSPRPATVSIRLGEDGYSPWTFPHWKCAAPKIALDAVPALLAPGSPSRLMTPQGVPFAWPGDDRNVAFTSRWDNWPDRVTLRVNQRGRAAWFLVCGSTNPMQCRITNGVLRLRYADGATDTLELVPPLNYWNLCPVPITGLAPGQTSRSDYTDPIDAFCLPAVFPETVQLGQNCRAMLLHRALRPDVPLRSVTLETLSPEVVIGLMGLTLSD